MAGPGRNLELKARDRGPDRSLAVCAKLGATDGGTLHQEDTYFSVPRGRLKLRREEGAIAQLIAYERPDVAQERESRYHLVEVADPDGLAQALESALGVETVVRKARRLFLFRGVRIHLDRVEGLGDFVELEGVARNGEDPAICREVLTELREALAIEPEDLISVSYSDLSRRR